MPAGPGMMFLFAYIGSLSSPPGWPIRLMHLTEAAFVATAFVCFVLAVSWKGTRSQLKREYGSGHRWYRHGFRRDHAA